jgi:fibro-slime domain-containing protein
LLALTLAACGSRTPIPECLDEGQIRDCSNVCGSGIQICHDGWWSVCEVPDATRSCTDICGSGTELCHAGAWQGCVVPDTTRPCSNICGSGTQSCHARAWQTCQVAPTRIACTNDCGNGTQSCADGKTGVCEVPQATRPCSSACGTGTEYCDNGQWHGCDAPPPKPPTLTCVIRDFHATHPDMELPGSGNMDDRGLVSSLLGNDDKPVYLPVGRTVTTSGKANFDQWYRNVSGVNDSTTLVVTLTEDPRQPGVWGYSNQSFFPIDNQLFGNENNPHNFHFTVEIVTSFRYAGGESFTFSGDDDVWVFINRRLAIDLGGIHEMESQTVSLDSSAASLGITPGNVYPMHIFFAERHTVASDFVLQTSLTEFAVCY